MHMYIKIYISQKGGLIMADFKKFSRAAALKILKHNCRHSILTAEQFFELGEKRENIDSSKTHLNYDLAEVDRKIVNKNGTEEIETPIQKYSRRFGEIESETNTKFTAYTRTNRKTGKSQIIKKQLKIRTDAVSLCSWVITAPKDLQQSEESDFFQTAYDFIADKYGRENIISADVHYDEATPHIHVTFMPIVHDKTHGGTKLCANGLETPKSLSKFHQQLSDTMEKSLGHKVGILNGATVGGNLSITQLKLRDALKKLAETEAKITNAQAQIELQELLTKVMPALTALDEILENRGFFKKNPQKQFKEVVEIVNEVTYAMQQIRDFPKHLEELGLSTSTQLDEIMNQAMITHKQAEERLKMWEKRLKVKDEEIYAEVDDAIEKLRQEREKFLSDKKEFEKEKEAIVKEEVAKVLAKSERRASCMKISEAWLKRTGGTFNKSKEENDYEHEYVFTNNDSSCRQEQKYSLCNKQMFSKD